jgi:glycosyltransferase involved in cell wall biosynthesis
MNIYFIVPIRGPINGAKFLSSKILDHLDISDITVIDTAQASGGEDFGTFTFAKLWAGISMIVQIISTVSSKSICYFNLTPHGFAFYRDLFILIILKLKLCGITVHLHANGLEKKNKTFLKRVFKNIKVITLNEYQKKQLTFLNSQVFVLGNTLPLTFEIDFEDIWSVRKSNTLLYFSNISEEKGIYEAVQFYYAIKEKAPQVQLKIAGAFLNEGVKDYIDNLTSQDSSVKYIGFVNSEKEKLQLFSESSMLLFTSKPYYEGYPLVYIESLMYGLPIITTPQHIADLVIQNENGFILNEIDDSVVNKAVFLLQNPEIHKAISKRSFELYRNNFNFEAYISKFKEILFKS